MSVAPESAAAPRSQSTAIASPRTSASPWESPEWQEAVRQNPGLKPFFDNLESFVELPEGVKKLREMILRLAVRGQLLTSSPDDPSAAELVTQIREQRERLIAEKKIRRGKQPPAINPGEHTFSIPTKWEWVQFGELGDWGAGSTPRRGDARYYDGDIVWLKSGELNNGIVTDSEEKVTQAAMDDCSLRLNQPGDVLIAMYGATIGKLAIAGVECTTNQAVCACTCFDGVFNKYLFLLLKAFKSHFIKKSSGAAQPNYSKEKIVRTAAPLPPLAEQRRIVSKVEGLMSLCDTLEDYRRSRESVRERASRSVLASLTSASAPLPAGTSRATSTGETLTSSWQRLSDHFEVVLDQPSGPAHLRQSILQLAVQGKLVPLTKDDEELLSRETVVGDYLTMQNGYAFKSQWFEKEGIRLVRNANIGHDSLDWSDVAKISQERAEEYERFRMLEGDIVLTLDRPLITTGLKVARITEADLPSLLLQRVARPVFKDDCKLCPDYFYTWLQSPFFIDSIDPGKSNGVPHISTREVQKIGFAPPTEASQKRIVSKVSVLLSQLDELSARLRSRQSTTDALLTALIHQILEGSK